jgi:D-glycero-beta-D-manno-heptose-7-phosphate kinase
VPMLVGVAGKDAAGAALLEAMNRCGVGTENVIADARLVTTTKVRVLAGQHYAARQQVIRIDYENRAEIPSEIQASAAEAFAVAAAKADAIVISDYGYGAVTEKMFEIAIEVSSNRNIPLLVDSRFDLERFTGATAATPNQEEVENILGRDLTIKDCERLRERLNLKALLVTRGNKGMFLLEENRAPLEIEAVGPAQPLDVTGAGDTVIAAFALGLASGFGFARSALIANHSGGIVIMKKGTATARLDEITRSINEEGGSETSEAAG